MLFIKNQFLWYRENIIMNILKGYTRYNIAHCIMSSDSLVLKIFERDENNVEINRLYVFYDHNLETFGIRGGYDTSKNGITNTHSYSYYTDTCEGVISFIKLLTTRYVKISMCLVKYAVLPSDSNNISYGILKGLDRRANEIVGFDYNNDRQKYVADVEKFLDVLLNVYNYY